MRQERPSIGESQIRGIDRKIGRCAQAVLLVAAVVSRAAEAMPPLEAYGRLPAVEQMTLSPSGAHYAFVAVHGELRRLGVATFESKLLYQAGIGDQKLREIRWAGDKHVIAKFSATVNVPFTSAGRYELTAARIIHPSDGDDFAVFDKSRSVNKSVFGHYGSVLIDGRWYGYFGGIAYGNRYPDLYRVDLAEGKTERAAEGSPHHEGWVVDEGGHVIAHAQYQEKSGRWQLYAGKGRGKLLMQRTTLLGEVDLLGLGRTPNTVLVLDTSGDEDVLWEVSVLDGSKQRLFDTHGVEDLLFDSRSRFLIGAVVPDERGAVFFNDRLQARFDATRKAFPGLELQFLSATQDLGRMLVKTDGGDDSGTFWLVDIASGKAQPVGSSYPQIRSAFVAPTRTYRYRAADGLLIEGVLTLPRGRDPQSLPLVVMPHGGPIGVRDKVGFDWWAQAFASKGYAVLQPNYRGSSGYSREFLRAGYGEWGGRILSDIADGVKASVAEGIVDPRRVCIVGASYGGYAALAGVTLQQGLYRCAVSVNGVADMSAFLAARNRRSGYHSAVARFWRVAIGAAAPGVLRQISPIRHLEHVDAPILLIHGQDDTVVPAEQSRSMAAALRREGKPVELVLMDGEDHWLSRESTRVETLRRSADFVLRHIPPQ